MPILQPVAAYSFRDRWHVDAPPARVREVLVDVERYVEWWPEVVAVAVAGEGRGLVLCRSVLPYTLELLLTEEVDRPERLEVSVEGDLEGRVSFDLAPEGPGTRLDFAQDVRVRGLLAVASLPARLLLRWNHDRMMRSCVAGLRRRVASGGGRGPAPRTAPG